MGSKVKTEKIKKLFTEIKRDRQYYLLILPAIVFVVIFSYIPMYGVQIAFKDYKMSLGVANSRWVGFRYFKDFFKGFYFWTLIRNTFSLSLYTIVVGFPIPIIFALLLNYLRLHKLKKVVQMVSYAPHFISTVVICGMLSTFLSPRFGVVNFVLNELGFETISFLTEASMFKDIIVWSGVWQGMGWNAIIYVSALAGVDYQLHEAAIIDGATKLQRMWHIDLPSIKPTIIMLLIMQLGSLMGVGFEKVYLLMNDLNAEAADVISTFTYRVGMIQNDYGYSTAVGLFNTVINLILLITANTVSRKVAEESLW